MEITKRIIKFGNSAGVLLPREWYGGEAKVVLTKKPIDIKKDIFGILNAYLKSILGIYLIGSYARNEETPESDIDVLVITSNINKRIRKNKYDLLLVSEYNLIKSLENNIMPLLPMIVEANPIINEQLIKKYKESPLTKKNLRWHIETTKSAINMNKAAIKLNKELKLNNVGDGTAYSLVLRLRGTYIINCLIKNKLWSKKEFLSLIKKITGSHIAYERYVYTKNDKGKSKDVLPINESKRLIEHIEKENLKQEKWIRRK